MRREMCQCGRWAYALEDHAGAVPCPVCSSILIPPAPWGKLAKQPAWKDEPVVTFQGDERGLLQRAGCDLMFAGRVSLILAAAPALAGFLILPYWVNGLLGPSPGGFTPSTMFYLISISAWFLCLLPMVWLFKEGEGWRKGVMTRIGRLTALFAFYLAGLLPALAAFAALCLSVAVSRGQIDSTTAIAVTAGAALASVPAALACIKAGVAAWRILHRPATRAAWDLLPKPPITW
jgi:hypothetical protein